MPSKRQGRAAPIIRQAARHLRRKPTPMEAKLWQALRDRRLVGLKFRRQHPHGRFILDYFCVDHQLEVEIDGQGHLDPQQAAYDAARTDYLQFQGIRVLRFSNAEVQDNIEAVLNRIVAATRAP